jgi:hypothetical protein
LSCRFVSIADFSVTNGHHFPRAPLPDHQQLHV